MPVVKPISLIKRHSTRQERTARADAESAMTPRTRLSAAVPAQLRGRSSAGARWKRLVKLYGEIQGTIITAFDYDLLVKYCLLEEEVIELADMRKIIKTEWADKVKQASKMKPTAESMKDYLHMWDIANALFQRFQGMDARLDGKRKLLVTISQSLYLTPRSRAGVAPQEKDPEPEKTGLEEMLS